MTITIYGTTYVIVSVNEIRNNVKVTNNGRTAFWTMAQYKEMLSAAD
jgi:hypothetical protein